MPLPTYDWTRYHVIYQNDRPHRQFEFDIELDHVIVEGLKSEDAYTWNAAQMYVCTE